MNYLEYSKNTHLSAYLQYPYMNTDMDMNMDMDTDTDMDTDMDMDTAHLMDMAIMVTMRKTKSVCRT